MLKIMKYSGWYILLGCIIFLVRIEYVHAQTSRIVAYVIENGIRRSVMYTSETQFKNAAKTLPVFMTNEAAKGIIDGIYIDQKNFLTIEQMFSKDPFLKEDWWMKLRQDAIANMNIMDEEARLLKAMYFYMDSPQASFFFTKSQVRRPYDNFKVNVQSAQRFLQSVGYYNCHKCKVDGIVGELSIQAYYNFIANYNLKEYLIFPYNKSNNDYWKIHFWNASNFNRYFESRDPLCVITQICITEKSMSISTQCQNNPSTGIQYDISTPETVSLTVSSGNASKSVPLIKKNSNGAVVWDCPSIGTEICIGSDPMAQISVCGFSISRDGLEAISFSDANGTSYILGLK